MAPVGVPDAQERLHAATDGDAASTAMAAVVNIWGCLQAAVDDGQRQADPLASLATTRWRAARRDRPSQVPAPHQMAVVSAWLRKTKANNCKDASIVGASGQNRR